MLTFASEIGCGALKDQLIILQNSVIALLVNTKKSDTLVNLIHPSHDVLWSKSNAVRGNIITALAEQYQRIQQRKPMPHSLPPPAQKTLQYSVAAVLPTQNAARGPNCRGIIKWYESEFSCELCRWTLNQADSHSLFRGNPQRYTKDQKELPLLEFIRRFHWSNNDGPCWKCDVCSHEPNFKFVSGMFNHCLYFHTLAAISAEPALGSETKPLFQAQALPTSELDPESKPQPGEAVAEKRGKFQALRLGVRRIMLI